jgi:hypothetical protein
MVRGLTQCVGMILCFFLGGGMLVHLISKPLETVFEICQIEQNYKTGL